MSDEIKAEVIRRTQDSLGKHIKKPPLSEKLLRKPPFRFLHDIINSVIRDTGFLQGVFTPEELNHENIKDREGKIAFLQKAIDAVKTITGLQLSVRPSKIVAGHEPTKTNEFLQAIGKAIDKKLDSNSYVAKPAKQEKTVRTREKSKEDGSKNKSRTSTQSKSQSRDKSRSRDTSKKKSSGMTVDKTPKTTKDTDSEEKRSLIEVKMPSTVNEPTNEDKTETFEVESKTETFSEPQIEHTIEQVHISNKGEVVSPFVAHSPSEPPEEKAARVEVQDEAVGETPVSSSPKKAISHEKKKKSARTSDPLPEVAKDASVHDSDRKESGTPIEIGVFGSKTINSDAVPEPPAMQRIASARPRTARPASARPAAPRIRDRGEVAVQEEPRLPTGKVNVITDSDSVKEQDEFENFVVEEASSIVSLELEPQTPATAQPPAPDQSHHGHLVTQILETQKELEDDSQFPVGHKEKQANRIEIEWETGQRREKEIASKEVDRLRASIQTLTRAANPLGKLMDFLQEDVDAMQRELELWKTTNVQLQVQLLEEQSLTEQSVQPMKMHLQQLQHNIIEKLDEISALKATILKNDMKIQKLVTGGFVQKG